MKVFRVLLVFLLCLLPLTVRSNSSEMVYQNGATTTSPNKAVSVKKEDKVVYDQVQYTPYTTEQAIRQNQSVRVTPEILIPLDGVIAYVDSLYKDSWERTYQLSMLKVKEESKAKEREAVAYLYFFVTLLGVSVITELIGIRMANLVFQYVGAVLIILFAILLALKIPVLLLLLN